MNITERLAAAATGIIDGNREELSVKIEVDLTILPEDWMDDYDISREEAIKMVRSSAEERIRDMVEGWAFRTGHDIDVRTTDIQD